MRFAYLSADFGVPVFGTKGASVHVRQAVRAIAAAGHEVLLLAASAGPAGEDDFPAEVLPIQPGPALAEVLAALPGEAVCQGNRLAKDLRNLLYASGFEVQAAARLADFAPHVLYERYSLFGTAGCELAARFQVPLLLEVNAPLVEEQAQQRGLALPAVARRTQEAIFRRADRVLVVSHWLAEYVAGHGVPAERIVVLPNAADPVRFSPAVPAAAERAALGWNDRTVVGFVGSMKDWHGVDVLLEAVAQLGGVDGPFRLLLVGDGPQRAALQGRARSLGIDPAVHFTGAVPHDRVPSLIAAMDVAVAPYAAAAAAYFSPVKLFEYLAMGRAVVAADLGQAADVVVPGQTGWLVPPGQAGPLAERLRWLRDHPAAAAAAGARGRQLVLERHTWRSVGDRISGLAAELSGRPAVACGRAAP